MMSCVFQNPLKGEPYNLMDLIGPILLIDDSLQLSIQECL